MEIALPGWRYSNGSTGEVNLSILSAILTRKQEASLWLPQVAMARLSHLLKSLSYLVDSV
jgi:hypothetical protein